MRKSPFLLPLLICATPALAQTPRPNRRRLPPLVDPAVADRVTDTMQALSKAFLDLRVGELRAAMEGREPTPVDKKLTIRDLARGDDPNFDGGRPAAGGRGQAEDRAERQGADDALPGIMAGWNAQRRWSARRRTCPTRAIRSSEPSSRPLSRGPPFFSRRKVRDPGPRPGRRFTCAQSPLKLPPHVAALPVPAVPLFPQGPPGARRERRRARAGGENPWEKRDEFVDLNPAGETPVMVEPDQGVTLIGSSRSSNISTRRSTACRRSTAMGVCAPKSAG